MAHKKSLTLEIVVASAFLLLKFQIWIFTWDRMMQDPAEPILLFTKPLVPEKLAAAGIIPPSDSSTRNNVSPPPCKLRGRIGRGGRIIFDRWNPLLQTSIDCGNSFYIPPKSRSSTYNWGGDFALPLSFIWMIHKDLGICRISVRPVSLRSGAFDAGAWRWRVYCNVLVSAVDVWLRDIFLYGLPLAHVNYCIA